jgi:hypothetical protein
MNFIYLNGWVCPHRTMSTSSGPHSRLKFQHNNQQRSGERHSVTYGNGDGRWATTTTAGVETMTQGAATTKKAAGSPPSPPPPVTITSGPDPLLQYALCIAISARGHSGSASPRKKGHVPFLLVAAPPLVRLRLPPLIRLSFASMAGCHVTFCRVAFTLRCALPFPVHLTNGSIAVAPFASPSRRPSLSTLRCHRAVHRPCR